MVSWQEFFAYFNCRTLMSELPNLKIYKDSKRLLQHCWSDKGLKVLLWIGHASLLKGGSLQITSTYSPFDQNFDIHKTSSNSRNLASDICTLYSAQYTFALLYMYKEEQSTRLEIFLINDYIAIFFKFMIIESKTLESNILSC